MVSGDVFTEREREDIDRAIAGAERDTDLRFSVYLGDLGASSRATAVALHAGLAERDRAVLVAVDPGARAIEVVTGAVSRRWLDDRGCALAVLSMTTVLSAAGDLSAAIVNGLGTLAEHARHPRVLHLDEP